MNKTVESIVQKLASRDPFKKAIIPTRYKRTGNNSTWSKSFISEEGKELETLSKIFDLTVTTKMRELFKAATSGDGDERSKIVTLHSSSLLAFLCFFDVSNHPITIYETQYNEVMFEVKNDVINASLGKPSNIDVLLMGENRKKLLFLESKFTEYLSGGKVFLSPERYKKFYDLLSEKLKLPFKTSFDKVKHKPNKSHSEPFETEEYCLKTKERTSEYLGGIKQAFSHLLGIATGPANQQASENEAYKMSLLENAEEIKFASIVFNCDNDKFKKYDDLYKSVFENSDVIKETIKEVLKKRELKLTIIPHLLQYQEVFQANFLHEKVREFYRVANATSAKS
ncbi:MAG: hypothetical protein ACI4AN_05850 [Muribaculaceae bacterium]